MRNLLPLPFAVPFLLLTAAPAAGQTRLGVTGGLNLASVDVSTGELFVPDFESVARMSIGVSVTMPISENLGFQLAGSYSQKGGRWDVSLPDVRADITLKADYFEVAGLGTLRLPLSGDRISAHLLGGPALALEVSCEASAVATFEGTNVNTTQSCDEDGALERSKFDLSVAGGGGIEFELSESMGLSFDAIYTLGLLDIDKAERDSLKHRVLTLRAGLVYSIG